MARVTNNVVTKRDYKKVEDGVFSMTSHRQITEEGTVADVFSARKQLLAEIKQMSDQKTSAEANRANSVINYDGIVKKAEEDKKELMNAVAFPKNFSEELLTTEAPESLVQVGMILAGLASRIKQFDVEIEDLGKKIQAKVDHYNEIITMLTDLKEKFWNDLEVPAMFSPELLKEKETVEVKEAE